MREELIGQLTAALDGAGEYYAAAYFSALGKPEPLRFAAGLERLFEKVRLPQYRGELLYPVNCRAFYGKRGFLYHDYSYPFAYDEGALERLGLEPSAERFLREYCRAKYKGGEAIADRHAIAGRGFTHFVPDFGGILAHGWDALSGRIAGTDDYAQALRIVHRAVGRLHARILAYLEGELRTQGGENLERLVLAYRQVPARPARNFFEAVLCINFIWQLDGCDSFGRFDELAGSYYRGEPYAEALIRELFVSADTVTGWNLALGGSALTETCIRAVKGLSKPNLAFLYGKRTEGALDTALEALGGGGGLPALYNENAYVEGLIGLGVREADARTFAFGGCSELMIPGKSCVGSISGGINLIAVLDETIARLRGTDPDFGQLLAAYRAAIGAEVAQLAREVNEDDARKKGQVFQLVRSLLCEGCAENADFFAGGATYNFSVLNVCGLANAADSLYALERAVFTEKAVSFDEAAALCAADFEGGERYLRCLSGLRFFGNDETRADELAAFVADAAFGAIRAQRLVRGNGAFLPACIMFDCMAREGERTAASPDGRRRGEAVCDSGGAYAGRGVSGPTALLNSVLRLRPARALGTWIVNLRLAPRLVRGERGRRALRALVLSYFGRGGLQLQINTADSDTLRRAMAEPEKYADLIVRVGGYSEYFVRLPRALQENILARSLYGE